jgi:hypothetical protein
MSPLPLALLLLLPPVLLLLLPMLVLNKVLLLKRLRRLAPEQVMMQWSGVEVPCRPRVEAQELHL